MIQERLIIQGDWTFCFGLLTRHLIGPDGCVNAAALLSIREICFFAKLRKGSMYWLYALPKARTLGKSVCDVLKDESIAGMTALLNAAQQSYNQRLLLQLVLDAGVNPKTQEDEVLSFAIDLHRIPAGSGLSDVEYHSLPIAKKLVKQLSYGPASVLLACFMESTHTQGPDAHNRLFRPMYQDESYIQHEEGFIIDDKEHTIGLKDWGMALTNLFVYRTVETFYLMQFSGRPVAPVSSQDQSIEPRGELVGLAHTFLPSHKAGFATKILKDASDDSFIVVEIEGYSAEERTQLRSELEKKANA